jgi:hypothetical protein
MPLSACMRHRREEFHIVQHELAQAVVFLVVGLGGIGAAVQLKIQLAHPGGQSLPSFSRRGRNRWGAHFHARQAVHIFHALGPVRAFPGRAAAAVAKAKQQVGFFASGRGLCSWSRCTALLAHWPSSYRCRRAGSGSAPAAVQAFPPEGVAAELVELVPGEFDGQEVLDAHLAQDLRQGGRIAKHIWLPEFLAGDAKFARKKRCPYRNWRTSASPEGRLQSGSTHEPPAGNELPDLTFCFDALIQAGVHFLHPLILLRLRARQSGSRGIRPYSAPRWRRCGAFAACFRQRPQPGRVDVGMPDRRKVNLPAAGFSRPRNIQPPLRARLSRFRGRPDRSG